jgi:hypothetical protein
MWQHAQRASWLAKILLVGDTYKLHPQTRAGIEHTHGRERPLGLALRRGVMLPTHEQGATDLSG